MEGEGRAGIKECGCGCMWCIGGFWRVVRSSVVWCNHTQIQSRRDAMRRDAISLFSSNVSPVHSAPFQSSSSPLLYDSRLSLPCSLTALLQRLSLQITFHHLINLTPLSFPILQPHLSYATQAVHCFTFSI